MAEKLMLLGVLILLVIAIGTIAEMADDLKAVRKTVTYLKEKVSSVDSKYIQIRLMQQDLQRGLNEIFEYLEKEIEKPEGIKFTLLKLDDRLRISNKLMAALARITLATETTVEKLAKPKIHQKWSDRK